MRINLLVSFILTLATVSARADDVESLYFTTKNGEGPKVVSRSTGFAQPVVEAVDGKKPLDCPPEAYWSADDAVYRCKDDLKYLLVSPPNPAAYPAGALILKTSHPGTDDPGPSAPKG
ncbi:hypothetical protein [Mesorhizobium onobrychidis]|uniref:Uncharacterized protein n=1 Tax=Mesorhizobium onobrychidis TaxID=2775404 RepID=A0ABY5QSR7_9HYPH|nr:hypothetical protein [Mesorhizobium onobrychidis]UVC13779.1 hypothetical protein IHQ72_24195 [Mesorhizobium onobrychidis]